MYICDNTSYANHFHINYMSDFNLKFSDIVRYILLGCIESIICYLIFKDDINGYVESNLSSYIRNLNESNGLVIFILAVSLFYVLGYMSQLLINLFFYGAFLGTGIGETARFIKTYPELLINRGKYPYPSWIYYSRNPDKLVENYREICESESYSDGKMEFLFANQLFQGIAFSLLILSIVCLDMDISYRIIIAVAVMAVLSYLGRNATRNKTFMVINKVLSAAVPIAIWCIYACQDKDGITLGTEIATSMFLSLCMASLLSRKQLKRIDIVARKNDNDGLKKLLAESGIPRVFILTRVDDTTVPLLGEQMESVRSQSYPNISSIVLLDSGNTSEQSKNTVREIVKECQRNGEKVQFCLSAGTGAAQLSYEIRQFFINYATEEDIAVCLDSDDKLYDNDVVERIVAKMHNTQSNICIIGFEIFGDVRLNFSKNNHNDLVKRICRSVPLNKPIKESFRGQVIEERDKSVTPLELINAGFAHEISTLGWTKCYRSRIMQRYQATLNTIKDLQADLKKHSRYEDFPDILALLSDRGRICAVEDTSILFRKREGSTTTNMTWSNYEDIIYFLKLTRTLAYAAIKSDSVTAKTRSGRTERLVMPQYSHDVIVEKFIPYKFVQYLNGLYQKNLKGENVGCTCAEFFRRFESEVYTSDPETLRHGIIDILNDNKLKRYFEDVPTSVSNEYERDRTFEYTDFNEVIGFYGITI